MAVLAYIGRFNPWHNGHEIPLLEAIHTTQAKKAVIQIGSSFKPRTEKNPFSFDERRSIIESSLRGKLPGGFTLAIKPIKDYYYNEAKWLEQVQESVESEITLGEGSITLIGLDKDKSSYYLNSFPQWSYLPSFNHSSIDATSIRQGYFRASGPNFSFLKTMVSKSTLEFLEGFAETPIYDNLVRESEFLKGYKKQWENSPYPVIFQTVDAVVEASGHILLVRRGGYPGKGLWALPGGFVGQEEALITSVVRELREETRIGVPHLEKLIIGEKRFDYPGRSERGRTITTAFHFKLNQLPPKKDGGLILPIVEGSDDADKAGWFSFSRISKMCSVLYEDHGDIINYFTGV